MRRKERDLDLVCMGRTSVDLYGEQVGAKLEDTQSFRKYVGGSATNVAVGTARLGVKTAMLTRVGDEQMGRFVRRSLAEDGVDVSHVLPDPERLTPYVLLAVRESEDFPRLFVYENSADMAVAEEDVDPAFIASSGALLVTGTHFSRPVTRAASFEAMRAAKEAGTRIAFDLDYRPVFWGVATHEQGGEMFVESIEVTEVYQSALPDCDLVVGTEEEVRIAGGATDTRAALENIRGLSEATIVLKTGALGATVFEGPIPDDLDDGTKVRGFPVEVLNTVGAGDAFMSGFLRGGCARSRRSGASRWETPAVLSSSRATAARRRCRPARSSSITCRGPASCAASGMTSGLDTSTAPRPATPPKSCACSP
jgi:5-dehydro-2-deoxygluconokinase